MSANVDGAYSEMMSYLSVDRATFENESNKEFPLTVRYKISNKRKSTSLPTIIYKDVEAVVQTPDGEKVVAVGTLGCEQTYEYTYACRYADATTTGCKLKGRISPEDFFAFVNNPLVQTHSSLSPMSYVNMIGELDIHKWLRDLPKHLLIPGPDTTLSQLNMEEKRLARVVSEIREAAEFIGRFIHLMEWPRDERIKESLSNHRNHVSKYLIDLGGELSKLGASYRQPTSNLPKQVDGLIQGLRRRAESLDKETESLRNILMNGG